MLRQLNDGRLAATGAQIYPICVRSQTLSPSAVDYGGMRGIPVHLARGDGGFPPGSDDRACDVPEAEVASAYTADVFVRSMARVEISDQVRLAAK